ncbi:hypothetical protein, partial [Streptomyces sp. NRRL F-2664]|uniref:hypothetical protein n=1 Tax=Streptomyces sp. NRRL F-2664 TaxID=1463842 RepID=UPI0018FE40EF
MAQEPVRAVPGVLSGEGGEVPEEEGAAEASSEEKQEGVDATQPVPVGDGRYEAVGDVLGRGYQQKAVYNPDTGEVTVYDHPARSATPRVLAGPVKLGLGPDAQYW